MLEALDGRRRRLAAPQSEQQNRRNAARCCRCQKQRRDPGRLAPDRLVGGAEQGARVGGNEETDETADDLQQPSEDTVSEPGGEPAAWPQAAEEGKGTGGAENHERPSPDRHG